MIAVYFRVDTEDVVFQKYLYGHKLHHTSYLLRRNTVFWKVLKLSFSGKSIHKLSKAQKWSSYKHKYFTMFSIFLFK